MRKINVKRLIDITITVACAIVIVLSTVFYSQFTSNQIFYESAEHLTEIYDQVNVRFGQKISDYRKLMRSWETYITITTKDPLRHDEFKDFIAKQKNNIGFTHFYLVNTDSKEKVQGKRSTGQVEELEFRRDIDVLLGGNDVGVLGTRPDENGERSRFIMFAVPIADNKNVHYYDGFTYTAIAIVFNAADLQKSLEVNAFDNKGMCYIVQPDGEVLLEARGDGITRKNYLEFLTNSCTFINSNAEEIKNNWQSDLPEDHTGIARFKTNDGGLEYYLMYMPVEFGDWMLIGMVPSHIVNSKMSSFRTATIIVMVVIFMAIFVAVSWFLIVINRQRVYEKEKTVKSRENLMDLLIQNTNDIFVLFSADDFRAEYLSSNINQVLGLDAGEVGRDVRTLLKSAVDNYSAFTKEGLEKLEEGDSWEADIQLKNVVTDEHYWYKMMLKHSFGKEDNAFVLMFSDRTQDRKMANDLEMALEIAKTANAAKSNFLSNMSHDIRTPMNAIIGFSTLLAKDAENPEKVREYNRKIMFSSQHLLSLINDILDMSKIESGKTSLQIQEFDFPDFLEEVTAIMAPQAKSKNQIFEIHTKGILPECVFGDKLRINQIMLNLLSNAIKYTQEKGKIIFTVESLDKAVHNHAHLRFTVEDNGMGMSKEFLNIIFEPFAREETPAAREIQGTGLGMTIIKNIVDLMGGTVKVESEKGKGSKFTVELELSVVKHVDDESFWKDHKISRVLVVDDEEDFCLDVQELMKETGVEVEYALSGRKAVEMISSTVKDNPYDIILLDWKMPEMDGVETAKRIREIAGKEIPIMVFTSYSFDEIIDEAKVAGINLFLSKPFFVSNFKHAVVQLKKEETQTRKEEIKELSLKGLKVLAAEDNEINAEILEELLDIEEVECEIAVNGLEALEKFKNSKPGDYDIIFMDIQMPVMNGYESARAIRECSHPLAKTIPIIAMTANAFDDDVRDALEAGMNAHLAKPINMDKLRQIVVKILGENGGSKK